MFIIFRKIIGNQIFNLPVTSISSSASADASTDSTAAVPVDVKSDTLISSDVNIEAETTNADSIPANKKRNREVSSLSSGVTTNSSTSVKKS